MSGEQPSLTTVGQRLRSARLAMRPKVSGARAGLELNVDQNTVYRWERDEWLVPMKKLAKCAEMYGVDFKWLLHGDDDARENDSVSRYLASPVAGAVAEDVAERLRRLPYGLFGYAEPDESDVASLRHTLELHLARAITKRPTGGQPTQSDLPPTTPKRHRKSS